MNFIYIYRKREIRISFSVILYVSLEPLILSNTSINISIISHQSSAIRYKLSVISYQLSAIFTKKSLNGNSTFSHMNV